METFSLFSLIKFGREEHIMALMNKGQIYMNHVSEFVKMEDEQLRGDKHESLLSVEEIYNLEISIEGITLGVAETGKLFMHENNPVGNIYSMYALSEVDDLSKLKIDERCKEFGNSFLIVLDVKEFARRFERAISDIGYKLLKGPVNYIEIERWTGKWSLFKKLSQYSYQQEFRFLIKQNEFVGPISFEIGSLNDIAVVLSSDDISNLSFRRK